MDDALRYQELIGRGYPDHTARHIVEKKLNDDQLDMMVVCGMIPEPRPLRIPELAKVERLAREVVLRKGDWTISPDELGVLLADYDQQGKMIEQLAAKVHRLADRNEHLHAALANALGGLQVAHVNSKASMKLVIGAYMERADAALAPTSPPAEPEAPLHEWRCPSCGATTRARMADAAEYCTCEPKPSGEAPDEPDRDCPVHGQVTDTRRELRELADDAERILYLTDPEGMPEEARRLARKLSARLDMLGREPRPVPLIDGEPAF